MKGEIQTMEEISPHCDIIKAIAGSRVTAPHIIANICSSLDFVSLCNAEETSKDWKVALGNANAWTHLFRKNLRVLADWAKASAFCDNITGEENASTEAAHREKCHKLFSLLKDLEKRIRADFCNVPPSFSFMFPSSMERVKTYSPYSFTDVYSLNDKYVGRGCVDGSIVLWNRWSKNLVGVYKPGPANIKHPTSLQFNKDILVAGYDDGFVHAWNVDTQEPTFVFYDRELESMGYLATSYDVSLGSGSKFDWLLTCTLAHGEASSQLVLSCWEIESSPQCFKLLNKVFLEEELALLDRLFADDKRTVLILTTIYDETEIQVRSTQTLVTLSTVTLPVRFVDDVHLNRGLLIEGSSNPIRLWNIESGECVGTYRTEKLAASCRFLSDDYMATIDDRGMLSLWDIHADKTSISESSGDPKENSPLWTVATGFVAKRRRYKLILGGDIFQMFLLVHGSSFPSAIRGDQVELSNESYVMQVIETLSVPSS